MNDAFIGNGRLHRPLAPLVLPAVYDDVLSYEEWLSKVVARCNELSDYIQETMTNLYQDIDNRVDSRVSQDLATFQQEINQIKSDLNDSIETLNARIDAIDTEVDGKISQAVSESEARIYQRIGAQIQTINNTIATMQANIDTLLDRANAYTDQRINEVNAKVNTINASFTVKLNTNIAELNARIDHIIREYPTLYDPATGFREDLQTIVYNLYKRLRYFGAPAMAYDDQEYTAEDYDNENMQAIKYDTLMGRDIFKDLREMFNPFTGEWETVRDVVQMLVRKLQWNGKTANEYDGYEATAGDFDNSTFGAYEQDTNQYLTETTPDKKNKSYRNWLFVGSGANISVPKVVVANANSFYTYDNGTAYEIPIEAGTYGDFTIDDTDPDVYVITSTHTTPMYAVTKVFDVNELDK